MDEQKLNIEYEFTSWLRSETLVQDWSVDWQNAPSPFKAYLAKNYVPLYSDIPGKLKHENGELHGISQILRYSAGCLGVRRALGVQPRVRRAIASGGALYPGELYLYMPSFSSLGGLYHYNPARHELAQIRKYPLEDLLAAALGVAQREFSPNAVLLVTDYFWKSYFKYADFSYRLGAVDVGVLIGRLQRIGARLFGSAATWFDFDDRLLNHLLGIDGIEESTYVVLTLGPNPIQQRTHEKFDSLPNLPETPRHILELTQARRSPKFDYVHRSVLEGYPVNVAVKNSVPVSAAQQLQRATIALPRAEDLQQCLNSAVQARASDGHFFSPRVLESTVLATCLKEGVAAVERLRSQTTAWCSPQLYCAVLRVQGIPEGVYRYDAKAHQLELIRTGSFGASLQKAMRLDNVNAELAACVFHFVDQLDWRNANRGCRAYRIQQMLIGAGLDGVMVAAAHFKVTAHPLLGFRAQQIDSLYDLLGTAEGSLAQICIGHTQHGMFLETPVVI